MPIVKEAPAGCGTSFRIAEDVLYQTAAGRVEKRQQQITVVAYNETARAVAKAMIAVGQRIWITGQLRIGESGADVLIVDFEPGQMPVPAPTSNGESS